MLALKNLGRRPVRTLLSLLGVAIGIAAIIAFNAIGRGFKEGLNRYMRESGAQLLVVKGTVKDPAFSRITTEQHEFIQTIPGVAHLSRGTFMIASELGIQGPMAAMPALFLYGRSPGERLMEKYRSGVRGRLIEADDEVMFGTMGAENLGLEPGDTLHLFGNKFTVVGIFETSVYFESVGAVVSNAVIQEQLRFGDDFSMGFLYLEEGADEEAIKKTVRERFPLLSVFPIDEFVSFYNQLEYIDWFVWIISLVSVAVGGLGVLNTMLMSVSERTREIGTLRAVGWTRGLVMRLILLEGLVISALGGLVGLGVGSLGAEILIQWAPRGFLDADYSFLLFVQAFGVAILLGFVGAIYPAWQASRLSPIEALKYE